MNLDEAEGWLRSCRVAGNIIETTLGVTVFSHPAFSMILDL